MKFFIVESRYHAHVSERLMDGATAAFEQGGVYFERFAVPSVLETPAAIAIAAQGGGFDGFVALGCVLGEDETADVVYREAMRGVTTLGTQGLAVGNGIIYAADERRALVITDHVDAGGDAARGALALATLRERLAMLR